MKQLDPRDAEALARLRHAPDGAKLISRLQTIQMEYTKIVRETDDPDRRAKAAGSLQLLHIILTELSVPTN